MSAPKIEAHEVNFAYPNSYQVLKEATFSIAEGETIGIIGPNGGGKSTLLKLLLRFYEPQSGQISINGTTSPSVGTFGYVPQHLRFDAAFPITCEEVIWQGALARLGLFKSYGTKVKQTANKWIQTFGLEEVAKQPFGSLSGGQAQKTLIARALMNDPEVLILDEPTASVDPYAETQIMDFLAGCKGKKTILFVTHELQSALKLADRFLCVRQTVEEIKKEQICNHYSLGLYHDKPTDGDATC